MDAADPENWNRFAEHQLRGSDRTHEELIECADLALAHNAERREDQADHHHQHTHDRGHVEESALETWVEPRARAQIDARISHDSGRAYAKLRRNLTGVRLRHASKTRISAIDQRLNDRALATPKVSRESSGNRQRNRGVTMIERSRHFLSALGAAHDREVAARSIGVDERP